MSRLALLILCAVSPGWPTPTPARLFSFSGPSGVGNGRASRVEIPVHPAELHAAALTDLIAFAGSGGDPRNARYLSLHALAPVDRDRFYLTLLYALRKTKWRQTDYTPTRFYSGLLVRLDLAALGWDRGARLRRIGLLKQEGVDTSTFVEDFWELLSAADPYWFTSTGTYTAGQAGYDPAYRRGWLDPAVDYKLRELTYASKAVLSAHQVLPLLLTDDVKTSQQNPFGKGGIYSQALLIPPKEADLYKALGVPVNLFARDSQLKSGAAIPVSYVAKANRELQFGPSSYPWGSGFVAITFDMTEGTDGDPEKNVFEALAGTVKHDGREIYFSKPDGDLATALYDGKGNQVAFVPSTIAVDQRPDVTDRERTVVNAYKCMSCHDPFDGIIPAEDRFGRMALDRRVAAKAYSKSNEALTQLITEGEDYYLSDLPKRVATIRREYAVKARACNGLSPRESSELIVRFVESYALDLVTPEQAAREGGYDLPTARALWRAARRYEHVAQEGRVDYVVREDPQLVALYAGQPVRRAAFEKAYANFLRADLYPWETGGADMSRAFPVFPYVPPVTVSASNGK